jgi:uncharacterized SAM-binding protein YcdF (DUF218 family)
VFHNQLFSSLGSFLVNAGPPVKADVVLVLDGDETGQRILTAAQLVRDGFAPQVLVSGSTGVYGNYSCDLAIPFAVKHGFPESYFVHFENQASSTFEEARAVLPVIHQHGYRRILLVTSDYHTRRAGSIYRAQAPDLTFILVAAPDRHFSPDGWWHDREGRKTFLFEWMKTVANWVGI